MLCDLTADSPKTLITIKIENMKTIYISYDILTFVESRQCGQTTKQNRDFLNFTGVADTVGEIVVQAQGPRGMEFLYSLNRLNVAASRAQAMVIVVASPRLLEPECRSPRQMQLANALCRYVELARGLKDLRTYDSVPFAGNRSFQLPRPAGRFFPDTP